jgi:farnesyl-diphosphate farnesyltransferase
MPSSDWSFCKLALAQHSRTFAIPIAMLNAPLEQGVTTAYLLCRIADTVEDNPHATPQAREELFRRLLDVLNGGAEPDVFTTECARVDGFTEDERVLLDGLPRVLHVFREVPGHRDAACWISELIRGMAIYAQRQPDASDGVVALTTMADLDRYCYFVAGAIGQMLTELFTAHLALSKAEHRKMQQFAEGFGRGLQLVNILRDMSGDLERRVCFVPRAELARHDLAPLDITEPSRANRVHRALEPLFELADRSLDEALEYVLSIPSSARDVRSFCLIPLWLAVATLKECHDNASLLDPRARVKLSRLRVTELIAQCTTLASNDDELRQALSKLRASEPTDAA